MRKAVLVGSSLLFFLSARGRLGAETAFNVTFVNRSGYPNSQVHLYVIGNDCQSGGHGYVDFSTHSLVTPRVSDVSRMTNTLEELGGGGEVTVAIPTWVNNGRIYFSYGADFNALTFDAVNGEPGCGPSDRLLYDKVEFYSGTDNMNMNSTNVDFFSLPITFSAVQKGTGRRLTYGFQADRSAIFGEFTAVPETPPGQACGNTAIYRDNLVWADGGTTWRVVAPDKVGVENWRGENLKRFSYFWNDYVKNSCWVPGRTISVNLKGAIYTGTVDWSGQTISWSPGGEAYSRPAWDTLPDPPPDPDYNYGHIIFGGTGQFAWGVMAPVLDSAIQRGVMHLDGSEWDNPANFFQGTNSPDSPVNHYARILHHYAINQQCYALPYDDNFGYDTSIYVNQGDTYTITLLPLAGSGRRPWIHDYNGDRTSDIGVFRPASGLWAVRGITRAYLGGPSDQAAPGDYNGDGTTDLGVFRPASGLWAVRGVTRVYFGGASDVPCPGDYNGDGTVEAGVFRPSAGLWALRGTTRAYFGGPSDMAAPGWYGGGMADEIAVFRPASGLWAVRGLTRAYFGGSGDAPRSGNYNGDGSWDIGIFRPAAGLWEVRGVTRTYFGGASDQAVPADYRGGGRDEIAVFRPASGLWDVKGVTRVYFGVPGDAPVTR